MKKPDDAVEVILAIARRLWPAESAFTEDTAMKLEIEILAALGGEHVHFPKTIERKVGRPPISREVHQRAYEDALTDMPTSEVQKRHNLSRASIYRLLKRGPVDPTK
ncbi:MAG: hypothetical protein ABI605_10945 [Rhizobacter sp.]